MVKVPPTLVGVLRLDGYQYDTYGTLQQNSVVLGQHPTFHPEFVTLVQRPVPNCTFQMLKNYCDGKLAPGDIDLLEDAFKQELLALYQAGCEVVTADCGLFFPLQAKHHHRIPNVAAWFPENVILSGVQAAAHTVGSYILTSSGAEVRHLARHLRDFSGAAVDLKHVKIEACDELDTEEEEKKATGLRYSRHENFHDQLQDGQEVTVEVIDRLIDCVKRTIDEHKNDPQLANISLIVLECTMLFMHHVRITEALAETHPGLQVVTVLSLTLSTIANTGKGIRHKQEIARRMSQCAPSSVNSDADVSELVQGMRLQWKYSDGTWHPMRWSSYQSLEQIRSDLGALSEPNKLRPLKFRAESSGDKWTFVNVEQALATLPTR